MGNLLIYSAAVDVCSISREFRSRSVSPSRWLHRLRRPPGRYKRSIWRPRARASGIHFEKVLDRLGIAKEIKAKSILNARAATTPSAEIVARGEAELGIQLISELVSVPGAELLGPLPDELQAMTVISAGIVTPASEPDAARVLFKFLTSPAAAAVIKASGMEPGS